MMIAYLKYDKKMVIPLKVLVNMNLKHFSKTEVDH